MAQCQYLILQPRSCVLGPGAATEDDSQAIARVGRQLLPVSLQRLRRQCPGIWECRTIVIAREPIPSERPRLEAKIGFRDPVEIPGGSIVKVALSGLYLCLAEFDD
jgi:hypothetical protein